MKKTKLIVSLSIIVLLSACSSVPKPLDMTKFKENQFSEVNLSTENEIQANFRQSNSATTGGVVAGGLIGAMIGAAIDSGINSKKQKKATQDLVEIRSGLSDFNFNTAVERRIPNQLNAAIFGKNIQINLINKKDSLKEGFYISGNYQLSDNFSHLKVNLTTSLKGKNEKPVTRLYSVVKNIEGAKSLREDNIPLILRNRSTQLRLMIAQSVEEALAMINKDYSGEYGYEEDAEKLSFTDGTYTLSGRLIENSEETTIIGFSQAGINGVYSVPVTAITVKSS